MSVTRKVNGLGREFAEAVVAVKRNGRTHAPTPPDVGFVLDLGAGHAPVARADLVVDKYAADDFERNATLSFQKPLVVGDGEALPFAEDTFAYVVASHVLEHAVNPAAFAAEMSRVGHAGFVQVPSREAELTFGWPFHPWLIDKEANTLVFHPRGDLRAPVGPLFHQSNADSALFRLWFAAHRDVWHHTIKWIDELTVRVEGESRAEQTAAFDVERTLAVLRGAGARGPEGKLGEALRCPADRGRMERSADRLTCTICGRSYPLAGSVPVLLAEAVM